MKLRNLLFIALLAGNCVQVIGQANFDEKNRERIGKAKIKMQKQIAYEAKDGKVIEYVSEVTTFDRNANPVEIISMEKNGKINSIRNYVYDEKNNQLAFTLYKGNKEKLVYSLKAELNAAGNKIVESGYDGKSNFRNSFTYDAASKLAEINYTLDKIMTEKRLFKSTGGSTEMSIVNPANTVISKETTIRDANNNILEESKYGQDNVLQYKRTYTYSGTNVTQITEEKANIKPFITYAYKYDGKNNLIEEKWTKTSGGEYSKKTYFYDDRACLVEVKYYNATNKSSLVYKYLYDFY